MSMYGNVISGQWNEFYKFSPTDKNILSSIY